MSDLVERLREIPPNAIVSVLYRQWIKEAADRITELEAEVARLRAGVLQLEQDRWQLSADLSVARKSLEAAEAEVTKLREDARSAIEAAGYRIVRIDGLQAEGVPTQEVARVLGDQRVGVTMIEAAKE